jgi:branched-chain amino acid transport system substrate-binding protein
MSLWFSSVNRRKFLQTTALGAGVIYAPAVLRAQGASVKVGVLHPVSGALSYSGQQGRIGAQMAIDEINAAGGIKAMAGAKIEAVLGDAQSTPEGGNAEVEKMNSAGVAAIVGGYASGICLRQARPRRATICRTSSTSVWSTASSRAG